MILYTLDTKQTMKQHTKQKQIPLRKTALFYFGISIFCIIFTLIYEHYSYGEHSTYMRAMFLFPLIGGTLLSLLAYDKGFTKTLGRRSYNLWNSGIAIFINGCLIRGIINISGRFTEYDGLYWFLGTCFLLAAIVFYFIDLPEKQHRF